MADSSLVRSSTMVTDCCSPILRGRKKEEVFGPGAANFEAGQYAQEWAGAQGVLTTSKYCQQWLTVTLTCQRRQWG